MHRASALLLLLAAACSSAPDAAPARADDELALTILHTSDEHSTLLPEPLVEYRPGGPDRAAGGFARLAAVVEAERARRAAAGEPLLVTSAGDHLSGSPFAWLALRGEAPELRLLNEIGYDVVTLGNHEFDYGSERLAGYLAAAGYPAAAERTALVATNTRPPPGHPLGERGIRRTHLVTLSNGLRVGFLGLMGEGAARYARLAPPVEFDDAHPAARAAVAELRAAGAQLIVAVTHAGVSEDRALARAVPGIHLVLGGHDHVLLDEPIVEGGTMIVHPGANLRQVVRLELGFSPGSGRLRLRNAGTGSPYAVRLGAEVGEAPAIAARVAEYRARVDALAAGLGGAAAEAPVARSAFSLLHEPGPEETALGDFVTDAMRAAVERATGERVDFAFQANGVIRGSLPAGEAEWNRGAVSFYDLAGSVGIGAGPDSLPGYPLVSVRLTGDEVRRVMEVSVLLSRLLGSSYFLQLSGARVRYSPERAVLARIPVKGTPIPTGRAVLSAEREGAEGWVPLEKGDTALYHVVTDRYVASFLPVVGRVVPSFAVVPKDRAGRALADVDGAIVRRGGAELKVWQAVLEHAAAEPRIPARYAAPAGRLTAVRTIPLGVWAAAVALLLVTLPLLLLARRMRRRPRAPSDWRRPARSPRALPATDSRVTP